MINKKSGLKANKYSSWGGVKILKKIENYFSNNRVMVSVGIVMLVLLTSIGYSALATSFLVSGEAHIRVKADIRITDIKRIESASSGYETYNPEYSKEGTKIFTTLPNIDSTLTYQVEITNTSSDIYALKEINEVLNSNPNIEYVIENIKVKDRIEAGSTVKFNITVKYKEGLTEVPEDNTSLIEINYKFIIPDSTPPEVMFSLQEGSYLGNRIVTITATDIGGSGYDFMNIEVHNSEGKVESKSNSRVTDDTYSVTLDSPSIWTIYVQAYDKAGNKQITEPLNENGFTYRAYKIKSGGILYDILQKEAEGNRYAKEYTGSHQDSIEGVGSKKIYHYYAANSTDGTAVLDKNNVIFAGFCWQMIRTTDTGGVKLIYNGEAVDGKCLSTRGNHTGVKGDYKAQDLNGDFIYGTSYTYDEYTKNFTLTGDKITMKWGYNTYEELLGLYTCGSTKDTCTTLYHVNGYNSSKVAYVASYTVDTATHYSQIGTSVFNAKYNLTEPAYAGYMYNSIYSIKTMGSGQYKYANGFTYANGLYKLNNVSTVTFSGYTNSSNLNKLSYAHYTCFNTTGECSSISYGYNVSSGKLYYVNLTEGNSIDVALKEMLSSDDVNKKNSSIKGTIDAWYEKNMLDYTDYLEDTIFCNNRSIIDLGGWNPKGGSVLSSGLRFKEYSVTKELTCENETDRFSVNNNKSKLKYSVGLMSAPEMGLLNNNDILKTGQSYWLLSPSNLFNNNYLYGKTVNSTGELSSSNIQGVYGVRPSVSLKPGIEYSSGDGSMANPYVVVTE